MKCHLLFSLVLLTLLSACGSQISANVTSNREKAGTSDSAVARINDLEFTQSELERELALNRATYKLTNNKELVLQDLEGTLQNLIPTLLLDQQAQHAGLSATEDEVTTALDNFIAGRQLTLDELEAELTRQGVTLADFQKSLARNIRVEKYLEQTFAQTGPEVDYSTWFNELRDGASIEILYTPPEELPLLGAVAPDFILANAKEEAVSLSQFQGRPVVINFWATWCLPCRREMPAFQHAFETYQDDGLIILAVNFEEKSDLVRPFIEEFGLTFEIVYDTQAKVSQLYQVTGLPRTIFVDRQGVIQHIQIGEVEETLLTEIIEKIL